MQALINFENEMQKAFDKIQKDFDRHAAVFKRLERELEAVKEFAAEESCQGEEEGQQDMKAAIETVYRLGYDAGYSAGAAETERKIFED